MSESNDREIPSELPEFDSPDHVLRVIVHMVNNIPGVEIGLTLHASGTIVSGLLVSASSYHDLLAARMTAYASDQEPDGGSSLADALAEQFAELADQYRPNDEALPFYIHMREASTFGPGGGNPLPPCLWRGRLSQITGWSVGNLSTIEPLDT